MRYFELIRGAASTADRKEVRHVITETSVVSVLLDRH